MAGWTQSEAAEMLYTMISIHNWEQLTIESGWSNEQYLSWMKILLRRTFINEAAVGT